ncbi:MAG: hypothetical protein PHI90_07995 [Clostridia bacterium]|nr:hypothetical protein [Clostridia bacterium]MDD4048741.1 hypothetical protein [Clostridia bacterium]
MVGCSESQKPNDLHNKEIDSTNISQKDHLSKNIDIQDSQDNENLEVDKDEEKKQTEYTEINYKNIPNISVDTLKNLIANIYKNVYEIHTININKVESICLSDSKDAGKEFL